MATVKGEEMHLLLDPGDDRPRFAEISLRVPRRMRQRHEHLPAPPAMLTIVVLHDRVSTGESVLVTKALEDALRRVPLPRISSEHNRRRLPGCRADMLN